jgi:hypothetical protein
MGNSKSDDEKNDLPSAVDDAADVMSKYKKKDKIESENKKFKFPPIEYERPPHY